MARGAAWTELRFKTASNLTPFLQTPKTGTCAARLLESNSLTLLFKCRFQPPPSFTSPHSSTHQFLYPPPSVPLVVGGMEERRRQGWRLLQQSAFIFSLQGCCITVRISAFYLVSFRFYPTRGTPLHLPRPRGAASLRRPGSVQGLRAILGAEDEGGDRCPQTVVRWDA